MALVKLLARGIYLATIANALAVGHSSRDSEPGSPIIDLGYSKYRGVRLPGGVDQFLGMRYAQPPVGELRFKAPREPEYKYEEEDASQFGALCPGTGQQPGNGLDEDCLFVNVFKPSDATPESKLPVLIYIQGGGYAAMGNPNYNGTEIIRSSGGNMIVVMFNYRVGVLGFLASNSFGHDADLNVGLLDQRQLFRWVQTHISKFGGDPSHVVIQGTSAGGGSVSHHLTAYRGHDKEHFFVGAILESPFWPTLRTVPEMEFQYQRLMGSTGCSSVACLRKLNISALQAASGGSAFPDTTPGDPLPLFYWLPVIDGKLIPDQLHTLFATGQFAHVPMLVGHVTNEGSWFANNASSAAEVSSFLRANYPHLKETQLEEINHEYANMAPLPGHAAFFPSASAAYGDATFACPADDMASAVARFVSAAKVWSYRYNVLDPGTVAGGYGVPHTFETSAVFGPGNAGWAASSYYTTNAFIVPVVMGYWMSFVRNLNPNTYKHSGSPEWETWGHLSGSQLRLQTNNTAMEVVPDRQVRNCTMWRHLARTMEL
ncbi:acetylcholinesterase [Aspergillus udagawae]|uniref:Carboxylic ester hydrolase n=1 Tax=Aspergillus udagawae TaxID=91492 RepID=A0ABQ1BCS6_9EURO|nr:acetylcholinesterase [Aspergillus udagawae]GFF98061.1 acetylcholinesterase [Aspergillus udagawae]GFG14110.1 acetylcholinesterase [Aspergillus udagawae]